MAVAPIVPTGFLTRSVPHGEDRRLFQVYVPNEYTPARRWPVILFLHGAGEGGRDALLPTEYQLGSAIRRNAARFPGIVVFPQVERKAGWSGADVGFAMDALASTERELATDPDRVYVTGVSSGARAAWYALYHHPRRFAAALVVCGLVRPPLRNGVRLPDPYPVVPDADGDAVACLAQRLRTTPVWTFHGDADPVFPVEDARQVMAALAREGAPARYTELAGFGHDVWDVAYYSEQVADWLFAQSRAS